ncbi:MAG: RidA family protein [Rhizobiales bacterium]|nr:RidA family protein [Hyphomicrobiales bacterium]
MSLTRRILGAHPNAVDRRPFSRGVSVDIGTATLIFVSGIASIDDKGEAVHAGDVRAQTHQIFKRMRHLLAHDNATLADVVKLVVFLKNIADYDAMNEVRAQYFGDAPPASSAVQAQMIRPEFLVEIEAVAIRRSVWSAHNGGDLR